jgi:hypothetical protein
MNLKEETMNRSSADRGGRRQAAAWRSALGVLVLALFSVPPVAAAGLHGRGAGAQPPPLLNPITLDVKGKKVGNVCEYSSSLELAPGQIAIREDSVLFDDATCTMRVQRGVPADIGTGPVDAGPAGQEGGAAADGAAAAPGRSLAGVKRVAATHSAGYYKSYFEDPVGIDVNSVRNNVDWYWNGSYVYNGYCSYHYGWYSTSGWGLHENNFFCRYENSQTQVRSSSYAHFKNGIFCAFIDTHTYYDRNNAYGKYNGYLTGHVNWRKEGGCTGLLSFHAHLQRTLN